MESGIVHDGARAVNDSLWVTLYDGARRPRPRFAGYIPFATFLKLVCGRQQRTEKDGLAFGPHRLKQGSSRANSNVEAISAVVFDVDDGTPADSLPAALTWFEHIVYTTHNHSVQHPRCRIVLPLEREIPPSEYSRVWQYANRLIGGHADQNSRDLSRLYYLPSCPTEARAFAFSRHQRGRRIDPDAINAPSANDELLVGVSTRDDHLAICEEGGRNGRLTTLVGRWIAEGHPPENVRMLAFGWNAEYAKPPLHHNEVQAICASIQRTHERNHPATNDVEPLFALHEARIDTWVDTAPPPRSWLLKDLLPCRKVGTLIAPGGTGKSQFVLQLAVSVASGIPLANVWQPDECGSVLYLAAEDDEEELHRRLYNIARIVEKQHRGALALMQRNLFVKSVSCPRQPHDEERAERRG